MTALLKKRIYVLALLLTTILMPGISRAADLDANKCKKFFAIWGYYTPQREAALKKLGLDDRQIDQFYVDMMNYFYHAMPYEDGVQELLDISAEVSAPQFIWNFRREGCWVPAVGTEDEIQDFLYLFKNIPVNEIYRTVEMIEESMLDITILNLEKERGKDALFSNNVPEDSYCDKVATLLRLMGEDEIFKRKQKADLKSVGASIYDSKIDDYVEKGNYTYRMACLFQDYLTEKQLDDLIYLYSTQEGINLTCQNIYRTSVILNMRDDENNNGLTRAKTDVYSWYSKDNKLLRDAWLLGTHQSMHDFQTVWDIIDKLSVILMLNDLEEDVVELLPGVMSNRSESMLDKKINDFREIQKRFLERK